MGLWVDAAGKRSMRLQNQDQGEKCQKCRADSEQTCSLMKDKYETNNKRCEVNC